ncbi:MAG: hypothetical protein OXG36_09340 [Caldilineaceae bacterium]|nr:hypothetical protein [Caldilineaceae bacterium]
MKSPSGITNQPAVGNVGRMRLTDLDWYKHMYWTVMANQPILRAALEETFTVVEREAQFEGCPHTAHRTVNGGHGRIGIRRGGPWVTRSTCSM